MPGQLSLRPQETGAGQVGGGRELEPGRQWNMERPGWIIYGMVISAWEDNGMPRLDYLCDGDGETAFHTRNSLREETQEEAQRKREIKGT